VRELRPGLWHWTAPHPDWSPSEPWDEAVSSYALDDGERLLLFDPIAPPSEIDGLAADRETVIVSRTRGTSATRRASRSASKCPSMRRGTADRPTVPRSSER